MMPRSTKTALTRVLYQIINHIQTTLAGNPNECFILEGYSQGAAATVDALPSLTGSAFNAVKGVFLIGDPEHKAGLTCNVDNNGGTTTRNVNGLSSYKAGIPSNWVSKTLDVCILVRHLSFVLFLRDSDVQTGRWCVRHERWLWYYLPASTIS